ncbi:MAG: hypothetical protein AUK39_03105 [Dehalococcoidia bacterium CG2_30_46_19]|nr:MAG: hypothetical protein AUK39_03105 [Dehalococcoidia bacterium CG2_30_46_19]
MGFFGPALGEGANAVLGQELWQKHKEIVSGFWDSVARFFDSLDGNGFKVYQDGMVADGTEGLRIIREGIALQSENYEIIGKLLERGAILVKTEDLALVRQEHAYITKIVGSKSLKGKEIAALRYKLAQSKLLRQRDDFIARRIKETLSEEEPGILFIGAYHDVIPKLPQDIEIREVKKTEKVREYQRLLSNPRRDKRHFEQLAQYLISPITLD